jgi:DNA-binding MarR family transcriptional regulator
MSSAEASRYTPTQGQYLAFIYAYTCVLERPPAEADLQRFFRVTPPSVHQMILTLEREGLIRRRPGVARSIELLIPPDQLPVLRPPQPVKSSVQRY